MFKMFFKRKTPSVFWFDDARDFNYKAFEYAAEKYRTHGIRKLGPWDIIKYSKYWPYEK